MHRVWR